MKQTLCNYALVIASALCLSGCEEQTYSAPAQSAPALSAQVPTAQAQSKVKCYKPTGDIQIYSIEIKGHVYIIFDGYRKGGIIHSESCPCKKEKMK